MYIPRRFVFPVGTYSTQNDPAAVGVKQMLPIEDGTDLLRVKMYSICLVSVVSGCREETGDRRGDCQLTDVLR